MVTKRETRLGRLGFIFGCDNGGDGKTDFNGGNAGGRGHPLRRNGKNPRPSRYEFEGVNPVHRQIGTTHRTYLASLAAAREGERVMTWQRIIVVLGFIGAAVALGLSGQTEMASAAMGIAGGATLPATRKE